MHGIDLRTFDLGNKQTTIREDSNNNDRNATGCKYQRMDNSQSKNNSRKIHQHPWKILNISINHRSFSHLRLTNQYKLREL